MMLWSIVIDVQTKKGMFNRIESNRIHCIRALFAFQLLVVCSISFISGSSHGGPSNSNTQKHHKQRLVNINSSSTNAACASDSGSQAVNEETIGNGTNSVAGNALPTIQSTSSNVITNSCFIAGNSNSNNHSSSSSGSGSGGNLNNNGNNSTAVNLNLKVNMHIHDNQRARSMRSTISNLLFPEFTGSGSREWHRRQLFRLQQWWWAHGSKVRFNTRGMGRAWQAVH